MSEQRAVSTQLVRFGLVGRNGSSSGCKQTQSQQEKYRAQTLVFAMFQLHGLARNCRTGLERKQANTPSGDGAASCISNGRFPDLCAATAHQRASGRAECAFAHGVEEGGLVLEANY